MDLKKAKTGKDYKTEGNVKIINSLPEVSNILSKVTIARDT